MDIKSAFSYFANKSGHNKRVNKATDAAIKEFDGNKDGNIETQQESKGYIHTDSINIPNYRKLKEAEAKKADTNSDGKISRDELKDYFNNMIVNGYDTNGNGDISGWEKFKSGFATSNPEKRLDELSTTENISGEDLKKFIDKRIDEMSDAEFSKLTSSFDRNSDGKIDANWESLSRRSWTTESYEGRAGDYEIYTDRTYRDELDSSFLQTADTNNDSKISSDEIKNYLRKTIDKDGNGEISADEYDKSKYVNMYENIHHSRLVDSETRKVYDPEEDTDSDRPRPPEVNSSDSSDRPRPPEVNSSSDSDRPRPPQP